MNYHTQEAFDKRRESRKANPIVPDGLATFYHIACLNDWKPIVTEQLRLAGHAGIWKITASVLGSRDDALLCGEIAHKHGIHLFVSVNRPSLEEWEHPTLNLIYEFACHNPTKAVLYFHSKGVRLNHDKNTKHWRRLMSKHVVADWRTCLNDLAVADAVGVSWIQNRAIPHFQGNFWMARCDWLMNLPSPHSLLCAYAANDGRFAGQAWQRMHCEAWLGSRPYHMIESKLGMDLNIWKNAFPYSIDIPGFSWEE